MAGDDYALEGFAVPEGVEELHALLHRVGEEHPEVEASDLMLFETAVVEIANNVVEHGRPVGEVRWRFTLQVRADALEATLSDSGHALAEGSATTAMPDELAESGRGLPLAHAILDRIDYSRSGDSNHWRMVRRHAAAGADGVGDADVPSTAQESDRVAALRALDVLDTPPEERFDRVVRLAQHIFGVPYVGVNLIDADRHFTKSATSDLFGGPSGNLALPDSLCAITIQDDRTLEIPDLQGDPRWAEHPVTRAGAAGYYAGRPLHAPGGQRIGALCLIDTAARPELTEAQQALLGDLAGWLERELATSADLAQGAELQRRLLPRSIPDLPGWEVAGRCVQAGAVGGDFYDWQVLDDGHVQVVLADVMGKGVQAALLAAGTRAIIRGTSRHQTLETTVRRVAEDMDADLTEVTSFVTLFAARFASGDGQVEYVDAGHGLAFIVGEDRAVRLASDNLPLGTDPDGAWPPRRDRLAPGEALAIVSDGFLDVHGDPDAVLAAVRAARSATADADAMTAALVAGAVGHSGSDDVTAVVVRRLPV